MHWKKVAEPSKTEKSELHNLKKIKLYADEDIEEFIVDFLREKGFNIKSARELGHRGKPDSFHAGYAYKNERFLLTKNTRDFFDDRKFPFQNIFGNISLDCNMKDLKDYSSTLGHLFNLKNYADIYYKTKIKLSVEEVTIKYLDSGQKIIKRFKNEGSHVYEWINEN